MPGIIQKTFFLLKRNLRSAKHCQEIDNIYPGLNLTITRDKEEMPKYYINNIL